jgi:hypothetical protein
MKNPFILIILSLFLNSCYTTNKVFSKEYNYNQHIDFIINKVEEKYTISDDPRTDAIYQSNPNDKFVLINLTILNSSQKLQKLNFNNFYLFDTNSNTQHKADWMMSSSLINKNKNVNHKIKEKGRLNKTLVFMFPKKEKPRYLKVNGKLIEIKFQS